jgi:lipopolysaccharide/colanic/teichoic acid biosynthesis glycosyltransferase
MPQAELRTRVGATRRDAGTSRTPERAIRALDVLLASLLLILLAPLLLALAAAIKLDSRGPVLYRCRRVGRGGREFAMLKLRKMR